MALRRVRLGLLLTEIGNQNKITVTEEDTKQAVMQQAHRFPGQEQQVTDITTAIRMPCASWQARCLKSGSWITYWKWPK